MTEDKQLIANFVPLLGQVLALGEEQKGSCLTEKEVIAIRDKAPCHTHVSVGWNLPGKQNAELMVSGFYAGLP